ncbi:hypothetical protein DLJ53_34220 [Acuticoccus sediminis]|uniref:Uncharacterized protein n=2 Tax=Acuticoccus sediminis TaxID=2184697 RepID=A0A8B2NGR1_9HYPH|nr:hypothetical protein DLJ53_34220 [Acuticoccus sediminis]
MLTAAAVIVGALWQLPELSDLVPQDYRKFLPLATLLLGAFAITRAVSAFMSITQLKRARQRELASARLNKLYQPMVALFIERHLTASSAILAPYLKNRIGNAFDAFRNGRGPFRKVSGAWRALGDRRVSTFAGMEYGGEFPLEEIKSIMRGATDFADIQLINCIRRADRSRYEEEHLGTEVTEDEYSLAEYIFSEHARLTALAER